jgi:2-polyprenyl-3-methyl-5-hydroxy-6-metoxy-1,4-benzoquinol methylase
MRDYDPYFADDPTALTQSYDFITCSETAEHFHRPAESFALLDCLLRPGGWLGLMTNLRPGNGNAADFARWHYVRDPTHVCFYSLETMAWLAAHFGWTASHPVANVVLMAKP